MFYNYFITAFRNIKKAKSFSLINILGLSVGLAACLLILFYVRFEKSYDGFHSDVDRIYRLRYERISENGEAVRFASCTPPAADFIRGVYPEVEEIARIVRYNGIISLKERDVTYLEERIYFAESEFFSLFDFEFESGDPNNGITEPNSAFVSHSTALRYFGDEKPVGQTITLDGKTDYRISGVFRDIPPNSHLKFDILLSFKNALSLYGPEVTEAWGHTGFFTYLKLKIGSDPQNFQKKMDDLVDAQCAGMMETYKLRVLLPLQPLKDIHLTSHYMQEYEANGSRESVNILLIVAFIIIVMAWVNYTNLSTARSLIRAKEVGLRKVVGASRSQLVFQFFFETVLLNGIALVLALILFQIALPVFLKITGLPFPSHIWGQAWFWSLILGLFFIGVIFSGFYPVTVLTAFNPAKVLKGNLGRAAKGLNLRRILVIFQFIFALTLITATLSIYRQVATMKNRDLGFDRERILVVQSPRVRGELFKDNFETFKNEILKDTLVQKICAVTEVPGRQIYWDAGGIRKAGESAALGKNYQIVGVDFDFVDVFNLKILLGRNFSREFPTDEKALLLNETAVHWMGFKNAKEAVGHQVDYWGEFFTIIGVLADYHQQSPKNSMEPHLYRFMPYGRGPRGKFAMKIAPEETNRTINRIEDRYMSMFPGNPFEYFFLDDYFNQQYRADELFGKVIGLFAFLAIFVTGLGIFGMSSYMAVQRTREIGIRKTLGATTGLIFRMMFKDFLVLIGISVVVAWPLTFLAIQKWLNSFAYRMPISALLFLLPLVLILIITSGAVSSNILKVANTNPVDALKYE